MDSNLSLKSLNRSRCVVIKNTFLAYIQLARPNQYVKNGFLWLPIFFGYKLGDSQAVLNTLWAFFAFSFAASAVYALNDIKDIKDDREHPEKQLRPLASGALSQSNAIIFLICILSASFSVSIALLPRAFLLILIAYLLLNVGYSFRLKHVAIIDVVCIAIGFVLRILAGGVVSDVPISHWIVIMTFLLAILLALGKRRDDLLLSAKGFSTRKSLNGYNLEFVSMSMIIMTSVVIMAYLLYCISPDVVQKHGTHNLYFTGFWVIVGLLRYLQITFVEARSGSPTLILLHDYFLLAVIGGWLLTFYWLIYAVGH
ncbi:MAG: UbiA prenyltransferase family protein [Syntrophobacteraceae bacterium]